MKFQGGLTLLILATAFFLGACAEKLTTKTSTGASTSGAMMSNAVAASTGTRLFDRRKLEVSGFHVLNDFIRPDVRARLDEEPTGDTDGGYAPPPAVS